MSSAANAGTARHGTRVPWVDVLLSAVAAVSWALVGMTGVSALGLHLLDADERAALGPMTAAVVALGAGGSVTPSSDVSAFGLDSAEAHTAVEITPLGVSLAGALLLSYFFLRSLRAAGVVISPAELLARTASLVVLFLAMLGGVARVGHDVVTVDGGLLDGGEVSDGGVNVPGLGDLGDLGDIADGGGIGGGLPDRVGDLVDAQAVVGFAVDTGSTLLGGLVWSAGVLLVALLASRRTPLPRGWDAVHRVVRPAASAVVAVLLLAVAAGIAAAVYAATGDDHPRRIAGAALLGAPNGVWLGVPIGLLVPWDGEASGVLSRFLPDPLDDLLTGSDEPVTLGRLAELDGRLWLLGVGAALLMLLAGVLTGVRTPVGSVVGAAVRAPVGAVEWAPGPWSGDRRGRGTALGFAGRCAVRLGIVTAMTLPLLSWLADVSVGTSLSVLGVETVGAGIELHGRLGPAVPVGAAWGAGAGAVGAVLAWATGAAGRRAAPLALGDVSGALGEGAGAEYPRYAGQAGRFGPYTPSAPYRPPNPRTNPYLRLPEELRETQDAGAAGGGRKGGGVRGAEGSARAEGGARSREDDQSGGGATGADDDLYGAPTVARPVGPRPGAPRQPPGAGRVERPPRWGEWPPPPPPPPPPRKPKDGR